MTDRILDLTSGMTMVISDLHGDKDAFARYMGRFLQLRTRHKVDRLLILGDLIHSNGPEETDESLTMLLDVIRMAKTLPPQSVVMLLGNHEMPHIYDITLARGSTEYTPRFEKALTQNGAREEVLAFLDGLPFYVRTAAGVMFAHAGPHGNAIHNLDKLRYFDHQAVLNEFDTALAQNPHKDQLRNLYARSIGLTVSYETLARHYLAVDGPHDPRYDHLIRAVMLTERSPEFELLWDILFTRCELGLPLPLYQRTLLLFLEAMSKGAPAHQHILVTGHIAVQGGHAIVTENHFRLASAAHAYPREAGEYLMIDVSQPIKTIDELEAATFHMLG